MKIIQVARVLQLVWAALFIWLIFAFWTPWTWEGSAVEEQLQINRTAAVHAESCVQCFDDVTVTQIAPNETLLAFSRTSLQSHGPPPLWCPSNDPFAMVLRATQVHSSKRLQLDRIVVHMPSMLRASCRERVFTLLRVRPVSASQFQRAHFNFLKTLKCGGFTPLRGVETLHLQQRAASQELNAALWTGDCFLMCAQQRCCAAFDVVVANHGTYCTMLSCVTRHSRSDLRSPVVPTIAMWNTTRFVLETLRPMDVWKAMNDLHLNDSSNHHVERLSVTVERLPHDDIWRVDIDDASLDVWRFGAFVLLLDADGGSTAAPDMRKVGSWSLISVLTNETLCTHSLDFGSDGRAPLQGDVEQVQSWIGSPLQLRITVDVHCISVTHCPFMSERIEWVSGVPCPHGIIGTASGLIRIQLPADRLLVTTQTHMNLIDTEEPLKPPFAVLRTRPAEECGAREVNDGECCVADSIVVSLQNTAHIDVDLVPSINTLHNGTRVTTPLTLMIVLPNSFEGCKKNVPKKTLASANRLLPVLVSVAVHTCPTCIVDLLTNLRDFVCFNSHTHSCFVVFHVSESGSGLNGTFLASLSVQWNAKLTHEAGGIIKVFVNPKAVRDSTNYLHVAHLDNAAFVMREHSDVKWSHVLFVQANERFVKRGLIDYVREWDLSGFDTLSRSSNRHHSFVVEQQSPLTSWHAIDDVHRVSTSFDAHVVRRARDPHFAHVIQRLRVALGLVNTSDRCTSPFGLPSDPGSLNEGVFLSHNLTQWLHVTLGDLQNPNDGRGPRLCDGCVNANEYVLGSILRVLCNTVVNGRPQRCGERLSLLMHADPVYEGHPADVRALRCSPLGPPFGFKRVSPAAATLLVEISRNKTRVIKHRDHPNHCD